MNILLYLLIAAIVIIAGMLVQRSLEKKQLLTKLDSLSMTLGQYISATEQLRTYMNEHNLWQKEDVHSSDVESPLLKRYIDWYKKNNYDSVDYSKDSTIVLFIVSFLMYQFCVIFVLCPKNYIEFCVYTLICLCFSSFVTYALDSSVKSHLGGEKEKNFGYWEGLVSLSFWLNLLCIFPVLLVIYASFNNNINIFSDD